MLSLAVLGCSAHAMLGCAGWEVDLRRLHEAVEARGGASAGCAAIPWADVAVDLGLGAMEQPPAVMQAMLTCAP